MGNPYDVLGVSILDSKEMIKSAYRRLCKLYHPDMGSTGNAEKFREVNEAWKYINATLSNDKGEQYWSHKSLFTIERKNF